jgi:hypothetical protein
MGNKKTIGIILLVVGLVVLIVSLAANPLGIGVNLDVFGWRQIVGTIGGAIVTIVGVVLLLRK